MQELMDEVVTCSSDAPETQVLRDMSLLRSFPGIGRIITGALLAEAAGPLQQRDYHAIRAHGGIAPVTRQSGKSKQVACVIGATRGSATRSITGRGPACSTTIGAGNNTLDCGLLGVVTVARSVGLPIAS